MKPIIHLRTVLAFSLFILLPSLLCAGSGVGINAGASNSIDLSGHKEKDYSIRTDGIPITAEAFWTVKSKYEVGIRAGLSRHIETRTPPENLDNWSYISISTIPFLAFARLSLPFFFAEAAAGIHHADINYVTDADDLSAKQNGFMATFSIGPSITLFDHAIFRAGANADFFHIPDIGLGSSVTLLTIGVTASIAWKF